MGLGVYYERGTPVCTRASVSNPRRGFHRSGPVYFDQFKFDLTLSSQAGAMAGGGEPWEVLSTQAATTRRAQLSGFSTTLRYGPFYRVMRKKKGTGSPTKPDKQAPESQQRTRL